MKTKQSNKTETPIHDLLEWIDRVSDRGITYVSVERIRERITDRIPMERRVMIKMANISKENDAPLSDIFDANFVQKPSK